MKYTFYTGLWNSEDYSKYWENLTLLDRETNVTTDYEEALDFAGNDMIVIEISNIPLEAIVGYRKKRYKNDDDYIDFQDLSEIKKASLIEQGGMFILNLVPYKDSISVKKLK